MSEEGPFRFPGAMDLATAQRLLAEAYGEVDEGKILRRTHKILRKRGIDPPLDVQYTAEPIVEEAPGGATVLLQPDILIYAEFPELDDCLDAFEEALGDLVIARLQKKVKRWLRRAPRIL